jgi:predicted GIY-YIG superfamily endonuclease
MNLSSWLCYLLRNERGHSYVGVTKDLKNRLRQHNGEIVGGAKYTRFKGPWRPVVKISNFPDQRTAMQLEWRLHHPPGKGRGRFGGIAKRIQSLQRILSMNKWTKLSPSLSELSLEISWLDRTLRPTDFKIPQNYREVFVDTSLSEQNDVDTKECNNTERGDEKTPWISQ